MDVSGWERLLCSYFSKTCIDELALALEAHGFTVVNVLAHGAVVFRSPDVFFEIGYETETAPNYSPTVVMGFGEGSFDPAGKLTAAVLPLWFIIPDSEPAQRYSLWKFSSEAELRAVLVRIRSEVIERYGQPLWRDTVALQCAADDFAASFA